MSDHISIGTHEASGSVNGLVGMIDTFDRPYQEYSKDDYAGIKASADGFENKPGKRIPKVELSAAAGVGHKRVEQSIFELEAKGPNVGAGVMASVLGAEAFAKAELVSASYIAGPAKAKFGLAVDTGASIGVTGVEAKILGTGVSIGRKIGVSVFGTELSFNLW